MELGLGTVQFGIDYGISNESGRVPFQKVRSLLTIARKNGIRVLDTAAGYGESEAVLGRALPEKNPFRIITKLPALKKKGVSREDIKFLSDTFIRSLDNLRKKHIEGLLLHAPGELLVPGGEQIYELLQSFKEKRVVDKIGVSVYNSKEIDRVFADYAFDFVQLPLNILDQRLVMSGHISELKHKGVEIHIRSAFLQGLLLIRLEKLNPYFSPIAPLLKNLEHFLKEKNLSPVEAALGFLKMQEGPDVALVGVVDEKQLKTNIEAFNKTDLPAIDFAQFAVNDETMVNPQLWKIS